MRSIEFKLREGRERRGVGEDGWSGKEREGGQKGREWRARKEIREGREGKIEEV
jgi:hypothetical protein